MENPRRPHWPTPAIPQEIVCGLTTFLTMSYILFVNPVIVSESGLPAAAVFTATALAAAVGSFLLGLVARVPLAMAPGMGLNTFFTYTICGVMGFHWREALAITFIGGLFHFLIMITSLRKTLVNAIPQHLKMAFGVGLGLFIAYIGLKNAGFLVFTTPAGQYEMAQGGALISNSSAVPGFVGAIGGPQVVALTGLAIMMALLALERKTGESYVALPVGIVAAAFVGIPLGVTNLYGMEFIDLTSIGGIGEVFLSFWGHPGLFSLPAAPEKALLAVLVVLVLLLTNVMDSIGTLIGVGQVQGAEIFDQGDMEKFSRPGGESKLDKTLIVNSLGGSLAAALGTTTATTYIESVTGIVAGGRTGLTAVVVGVMFLLCLPLSGFFSVIPSAAIAPALIVAGAFMIPLVGRIDWVNFEEGFPAFMTIVCIPLTYGFIHGIAAGVLSHVVIQLAVGKGRELHPMLVAIAAVFIAVIVMEAVH